MYTSFSHLSAILCLPSQATHRICLDESVDFPYIWCIPFCAHLSSSIPERHLTLILALSQTPTSMVCDQLFHTGCNYMHGQAVRPLLSSHVSFPNPEYRGCPTMSCSPYHSQGWQVSDKTVKTAVKPMFLPSRQKYLSDV